MIISSNYELGRIADIFGEFMFVKNIHSGNVTHAMRSDNPSFEIGDYVAYDNVHGEAQDLVAVPKLKEWLS